jgi:hypothetical protein
MKNILSSLTNSEKNRILEMHKSATRKIYLKEEEWRGSSIFYDKTFNKGTAKIYPSLFIKDDTDLMEPALVVKYDDKLAAFIGMWGANPTAMYTSPSTTDVVGDGLSQVANLVVANLTNPTGWNEYQWIQFLEKQNTNNVLTAGSIATILSSLSEVGITTKFGTMTPSGLAGLKLSPDKLAKYTQGIANSGVNSNFKTT